ncbi:unnamed protein product [Scytosiphon promiscuus]
MVFWESFCAAAFTAGSAACVFKLLSPQQQQPQALSGGSMPFVATMLLACLLSVFALLSVKGTHACWRPSSGSPWKGSCGSSGGTARAASTGGSSASSGSQTPERTRISTASGKGETRASTPPASPPSHDGSGDDEGAGPEDFPLERRSSFVEVALSIHG